MDVLIAVVNGVHVIEGDEDKITLAPAQWIESTECMRYYPTMSRETTKAFKHNTMTTSYIVSGMEEHDKDFGLTDRGCRAVAKNSVWRVTNNTDRLIKNCARPPLTTRIALESVAHAGLRWRFYPRRAILDRPVMLMCTVSTDMVDHNTKVTRSEWHRWAVYVVEHELQRVSDGNAYGHPHLIFAADEETPVVSMAMSVIRLLLKARYVHAGITDALGYTLIKSARGLTAPTYAYQMDMLDRHTRTILRKPEQWAKIRKHATVVSVDTCFPVQGSTDDHVVFVREYANTAGHAKWTHTLRMDKIGKPVRNHSLSVAWECIVSSDATLTLSIPGKPDAMVSVCAGSMASGQQFYPKKCTSRNGIRACEIVLKKKKGKAGNVGISLNVVQFTFRVAVLWEPNMTVRKQYTRGGHCAIKCRNGAHYGCY